MVLAYFFLIPAHGLNRLTNFERILVDLVVCFVLVIKKYEAGETLWHAVDRQSTDHTTYLAMHENSDSTWKPIR